MRAELPALAEEVIDAIGREVPGYARPMRGAFGRGVRVGVEQALTRFLDGAESSQPTPGLGSDDSVYVVLGRGEHRVGRSLDALQAAYRVGARVSWRRLGAVAAAADATPEQLVALGEAIFAYIDELASESVEGFAAEQSASAGRRDRARDELVALLCREPGGDPAILAELATEAGWPLPERLAAVVGSDEALQALARVAGPALLSTAAGAFLADPDAPGVRARLVHNSPRASSAPVWLGSVVPPARAARSLARAQGLARLRPEADGTLWADDHLAALVVHADADALGDLAARALEPLAALAPGARARALATLRAFLDHHGNVAAMAQALHLHPQTVRYRLARLRDAFGATLDDPDTRFALSLVLRSR